MTECENVFKSDMWLFPADTDLILNVNREMVINAQRRDPLMVSCFYYVETIEGSEAPMIGFMKN